MQNISTDATRRVATWSANDLNYLYPILSRQVWLCLEIQHNQQLFPKRSGSPGSYHIQITESCDQVLYTGQRSRTRFDPIQNLFVED